MIHANYINIADNVPFMRVYRSIKAMRASYRRMKGVRFDHAVDLIAFQIIKSI